MRFALLLLFASVAIGRPLELEDYYRVETASAPALSPDGRWVVFVRTHIVEAENRRRTELWISPSDGSAPAVKLNGAALDASSPRWSPDGKLLAFRVGTEIWFLHMGGAGSEGDAFQIPGVGGMPIFSPDNRWIAFTKKTPPPPEKPDESPFEKQLDARFKGKIYDWMNIRYDQRGYLGDPRDPHATPPLELYVVAREGGAAKQLTHLNVNVTAACWRPDSGALALVADSHQRDEFSYERADLWTVDLEGQIRRLTDDGFEYAAPTWSPDGKHLAFLRSQGLNLILKAHQHYGAAIDIYRMPAAGGPMKNLTQYFDLIPEAPEWTGDTIYFRSEVGGDGHLFRMAAAGGAPVQLTKGERAFAGFSFSEHFDRIAYVAQDPTHPYEAFSAGIDGSGEKRLSKLNDALLSEVDLNPAERIHFPSKDGTSIEGWIVKPRSAKAPYPLILSIHGGPHMALGSEFDFEVQWLSNSYAVLYTNRTRVNRIRRKVPMGHVEWLGQAGLSGRDGRRGLCGCALSRRPETPGCNRLLVWRVLDQLGDHSNHALQSSRGGRRHFQLAERLWHRRYSPHQGERIFGRAVEPGSRRTPARTVSHHLRR